MAEAYHATKLTPNIDKISVFDEFPNCSQKELIEAIDKIHRSDDHNENFENIIILSDFKAKIQEYNKRFQQSSRKIS